MAQTFAMKTKVNRQWENLFAQNMRLREDLGHYTGESSRVQVLETENARLKAELSQAPERSAKSDADHRRAREEWFASCAKMNDELKDRTDAYRRHNVEAI
jgi:hypothetical protein